MQEIETENRYDRMVFGIEQLMDKGETRWSAEETMAILIQAYDDRHHPVPAVPPSETLTYLMESSHRTAKDLLMVFGTRGRVSEVLNGKRSISKVQAKQLASLLKVSADLFL